MGSISLIENFFRGDLDEAQLLAEVDRVLASGDPDTKTILIASVDKYKELLPTDTLSRLYSRMSARETAVHPGHIPRDRVGSVINHRFVLEKRLGSGGMGEVYKALDLRREEAEDRYPYVAIKILSQEATSHPDAVKILQREARKTQSLSHPNIVMVYDFDREGDLLFLTMELLVGETLSELLRRFNGSPLPRSLFKDVFSQICAALEFAHSKGVVHLDLKPGNIFVEDDGRVKIIDFGISRVLPKQGADDKTTFDVRRLGAFTPAYASLEMFHGLDVDARDDVFALACIAYELISGRHPYQGLPATIAQVRGIVPSRPPELTDTQWDALRTGLELDRAKRVIKPAQMAARFDRSVSDEGLSGNKTRYVIAALFCVVLLVGGIAIAIPGMFKAVTALRTPPESGLVDPAAQAAQQEAARRAAEQAVQAAQQEAARRVAEQAAQAAQQEAARKVAEQAAQAAQQEAARRVAEQAAQAAQQEAARRAAEQAAQAAQQEAARRVAEQAAQAAQQEAARKAAEQAAQAAQQEAARRAAEQAAQAAQQEAARKAAEQAAQAAQQEAARKAAEQAAQAAQQEAARRAAEQAAQAAQQEAARKAAEQATHWEAIRRAEAARRAAELAGQRDTVRRAARDEAARKDDDAAADARIEQLYARRAAEAEAQRRAAQEAAQPQMSRAPSTPPAVRNPAPAPLWVPPP